MGNMPSDQNYFVIKKVLDIAIFMMINDCYIQDKVRTGGATKLLQSVHVI